MLKKDVYVAFKHAIQQRIELLQASLADLKETGRNETKSTAGDKHEIALAMVQLEQEKIRGLLKEVQQQLVDFEKIDPSRTTAIITCGSLVGTDRGLFWISLALGKITIDGKTLLALSAQSPLGASLIGCKTGDCITVHAITYTIRSVE